jgi:hypothetical protein
MFETLGEVFDMGFLQNYFNGIFEPPLPLAEKRAKTH